MGGAQPLAVTMNDGVAICVECDQSRITRRIEHRYLDVQADSLDHALELAVEPATPAGRCRSRCSATPRTWSPSCWRGRRDRRRHRPDLRATRCTTCPRVAFEDWAALREKDPAGLTLQAQASMARHVEAMVGFQDAGAEVFDYGNSIRDEARKGGYARAFEFPGFVPAYIRPLFCQGKGRSAGRALGRPRGHRGDRPRDHQAVPGQRLRKWITMAGERVSFQGLPAGSAGSGTASGTSPG